MESRQASAFAFKGNILSKLLNSSAGLQQKDRTLEEIDLRNSTQEKQNNEGLKTTN